ncbi:hypothetical protein AHAS_Ahas03G0178500 [Arachis hypogaea]
MLKQFSYDRLIPWHMSSYSSAVCNWAAVAVYSTMHVESDKIGKIQRRFAYCLNKIGTIQRRLTWLFA